MKTTYILVDYENVQPVTLQALHQEHIKILVFVGAHQTKISLSFATSLQQFGQQAQYIQICGSGSNALDFHIAFAIGQLATTEPDALFFIISKDSGFDPLLEHLKHKNIQARRFGTIADLPSNKSTQPASPADRIALVITNLRQRGASKPRTTKTLVRTISALFGQKLTEQEMTVLIRNLEKQAVITINEGKVTYNLPH